MIDRFEGQYRFLSNFAFSPVQIRLTPEADVPTTCPTVEHAFQACKTVVLAERLAVIGATSPGKAKRLGRTVTLRPGWRGMRVQVMRQLLAQKFEPGSDLARHLLATGDQELVEGNDWGDRFWGVSRGCGENQLGRLLMERREALR